MIHSTLEEQLDTTCPNCGHDHHAKFFSLLLDRMHYVIGDCDSCGYRIEFRKDELGAGLFMPDGKVATVKEMFKKEHVDHMKERLASGEHASDPREKPVNWGEEKVLNTFSTMRLRFLDDEPIREERERH